MTMGVALVRSKSALAASERASPIVRVFRVAADMVVFTIREQDLKVLLVRRDRPPFRGYWALPGGFVEERESVEAAARRLLRTHTYLEDIYLEQLYTFGEPDRDPRGRVISVAYFALSESSSPDSGASDYESSQSSEPRGPRWLSVYDLPPLAFDHRRIVAYALERLRNKLDYTTVGFELLPRRFTLSELQRVYEIILAKPLDKRNFRKKILSLRILNAENETRRKNGGRPARLYRLARNRFIRLKDRGILFPF